MFVVEQGAMMGADDRSNYVVVSADSHAGADIQAYRPYLASRFHDEFDAWAASYENPWDLLGDPGTSPVERALPNEGANWNNEVRLSACDQEGIACEIVFPNTIPPFFPSYSLFGTTPSAAEYPRRWAGLQASNRWLADFCQDSHGRRAGLAQVLLNDVDDAVAEISWAKENGLSGVLIGSVHPGHPTVAQFYDRKYDPIWAACQDLELPVNQHNASGAPDNFDPRDAAARACMLFDYAFLNSRSVTTLTFGGVFERFPDLRVVFAEAGAAWVPPLLAQLDSFWVTAQSEGTIMQAYMHDALSRLPMKPSEYFSRNCSVATFLNPADPPLRASVGVGNMMWASDFPHEEGSYPFSREAIRAAFADVPVADTRKILGLNAARIYNLNLPLLETVADRIGPTVDEVRAPVMARPAGARPVTAAFAGLPALRSCWTSASASRRLTATPARRPRFTETTWNSGCGPRSTSTTRDMCSAGRRCTRPRFSRASTTRSSGLPRATTRIGVPRSHGIPASG
jgi:predicted TIM-barrel fold metal-dependent hydrolase